MIRRLTLLTLLALTLAGCAPPAQDDSTAEPVMAPAMVAPLAAAPQATTGACQPGDDGIGGTGCKLN
jgi:hypothetical protein